VARVGADGAILWTRKLTGPGNESIEHVDVDGEGNVIVAGFRDPGASFEGVPLADARPTVFVMKLGPDGELRWDQTWAFGYLFDVAAGATGDIAIVGGGPLSIDECDGARAQLIRLSPDGEVTGALVEDGWTVDGSIAAAPDGTWIVATPIYAGGSFGGAIPPDPSNVPDIVVARVAF
jgi:hypothetical protein